MHVKKLLNTLKKLLALGFFILAGWLLYQKLRIYSLEEIRLSLLEIPPSSLLLSLLMVFIIYATVMIGYDWLALKAIRKMVNFRRLVMVSFVGGVVGYNFGALLAGGAVRYRLYSAWGFTPMDIFRLVLMLALTFWVGALGLGGIIFLIAPPVLPPELGLGAEYVRPLGAVLVITCLAYLWICAIAKGGNFTIFGKVFLLPPLHIAVAQTLVAGAEMTMVAFCLYLLLPTEISFLEFLPSYVMAQAVVVLTHVPGGVGVLEAVLLNLLPGIPSQIFAVLVMFRVIFYLIPLVFAACIMGLHELHLRRSA